MFEKAVENYKKNQDKHLQDLIQLSKIPSVSFPGYDPKEVERSAEAVKALLTERGLENAQVIKVEGCHPYVYADWLKAPGKPTVLLYAHHDVQPPMQEDKWKSPPFEPTIRDGRLYGRGTADDKAGIVCHSAAVASYLQSVGSLPLNVKFLIEGEEEIGSEHLEDFLKAHKELVQADVIVLTDTANFDVGLPALTVALRGLVGLEVEVKALDHSLHSGLWGGPIPDPALALCQMISTLSDSEGRITLPGVLAEVRQLSETEKKELDALPYDENDFRKQSSLLEGVEFNGGEASTYEKIWYQPSLSVNAFEANSRKTAGNIINASAWAKIGVRIVPNLEPQKVYDEVKAHLEKICPWGLKVDIKAEALGGWWYTKPEGPAFDAARKALKFGYGVDAVMMGSGGSIPFVTPFAAALGGSPALLMGVEDPYTAAHSENESLHLEDWSKAILSAIRLYAELAETKFNKK